MHRSIRTPSLLLAGLLAAGAALAQSSPTSPADASAPADVVTVPGPAAIVVVPSDTPVVVPDASSTGTMGASPAPAMTAPATTAPAMTGRRTAQTVPTAHDVTMGAVTTRSRPVQISHMASGEASTYVGGQPNANPDDPRLQQ